MGLAGNLKTMAVPEVLQWVAIGRQTGTLTLRRGRVRKSLTFEQGKIHSTASDDPSERLSDHLVRRGLISETDLLAALLDADRLRRPLGTVLLESGALTAEQLELVLREKAEESIRDLVRWSEGSFEFEEGELAGGFLVKLALDVTNVVLDVAEQAEEWDRVRRVVPSADATFRVCSEAPAEPLAEQAVSLAAAGAPVSAIAVALGRSELEVTALLAWLVQAGVLEVASPSAREHPDRRLVAIDRLLENARRSLAAGDPDRARAGFESVLLLDRLNIAARKGLAQLELAESKFAPRPLDRSAVPLRCAAPPRGRRLDRATGFLLARIDDRSSIAEILAGCPIAEAEVTAALEALVEEGIVRLDRRR